MTSRAYLDWNATAPLRPGARAAMCAAMEVTGNPSSVHAEGREARSLVARARGQVAALIGARAQDVIFTSGATEAAALWFAGRGPVAGAAIEHDAVHCHLSEILGCDAQGLVAVPGDRPAVLQGANSETGVIQPAESLARPGLSGMSDITQLAGRVPFDFAASGLGAVILSAHKLGGPKGVGALVLAPGTDLPPGPRGGGQERGRRGGTENVIGIAGFGAAAEAAAADLTAGVWGRVAELRDGFEARLRAALPELVIFGSGAPRLPNTSCFGLAGWKGETQVMQMDLAGFAVSAGSACSSGKTGPSRVLAAMGAEPELSGSALRVSIGPDTTGAMLDDFAAAWLDQYRRHRRKAA